MRQVLLIKTSSMGDIIHTLPALTDALSAFTKESPSSSLVFDWVVEEDFVAIPKWHPAVRRVIPVALRRWRKNLWSRDTLAEWRELRKELREYEYDLILDAQGLVKSAALSLFAKGKRAGLDFKSAREALASLAYQQKYSVNFYQHAIHRMRSLFALSFDYPLPTTLPDFGLSSFIAEVKHKDDRNDNVGPDDAPYLVFIHGTTWTTKQWPQSYWIQLAKFAADAHFRVKISGNHPDERERALQIAKHCTNVDVIPMSDMKDMAQLLLHSKAVVAVDTGLGHLAAALSVPTISIYGATHPGYTGALGRTSVHLAAQFACAPCLNRVCAYKEKGEEVTPACYTTITPRKVWETVLSQLG